MRAALVLVAALTGCASVKDIGQPDVKNSVQITISAEEAQRCIDAGGCGLMTKARVAEIQFQTYVLGQREALGPEPFDSHGCKRGDT
jgi:hypothetical protein